MLSPHPVLILNVWLNMDQLVWAPNLQDSTSLPSHTPAPSLPPLPISKHTETHIFLQHVGILIINTWVLFGLYTGDQQCEFKPRTISPALFLETLWRLQGLGVLVGTEQYLQMNSPTSLNSPGSLHPPPPPSPELHSVFYRAGSSTQVSLTSFLFYACQHSAPGLILPWRQSFVPGRKTR